MWDFLGLGRQSGRSQKSPKSHEAKATTNEKLETIYQQKINDLEELKKSVLQKAFSRALKEKELMK